MVEEGDQRQDYSRRIDNQENFTMCVVQYLLNINDKKTLQIIDYIHKCSYSRTKTVYKTVKKALFNLFVVKKQPRQKREYP